MLVGSGLREADETSVMAEGVEYLGHVPDTTPYLDAAAVSVAPLRYGGGMKGKVNEALAHGVPVVTTSIGAQGFDAADGREMFIADEPLTFANAVVRLLGDRPLQEKIGAAGQALNARYCSPEVVETLIGEMMERCAGLLHGERTRPSAKKLWQLRMNRVLNNYYWGDLLRKSKQS